MSGSGTWTETTHARDGAANSGRRRAFLRLTEGEKMAWVSVEEEGLRPAELETFVKQDASTIRTLLSRARSKMNQ